MLWRRCSNVETTSWQRWRATLSQRRKRTSVQLSFSTVPQRDNVNNDVVTTLSQRRCACWDSDYPVSIDSKYYNSDSNKLNIKKIPLLWLILILRCSRSILRIYKMFYPYWNIFLILLAFRNMKLIKIQWTLILLCRDILFILMKPKAPAEEQVFLFLSTQLLSSAQVACLMNQGGWNLLLLS